MVSSNNAINNTVGADITGVTNELTVTNPSNTASSAALSTITVGGASSGDAWQKWSVNSVTDWSMGIDNDDSDKLIMSQAGTLGSNNVWEMTTAGERTMPLQPAFIAFNTLLRSNVTGDGTLYTVIFDTVITDANSDYDNTTGTFTAPVSGSYALTSAVRPQNVSSAMVAGEFQITTSNRTFYGDVYNPSNVRTVNNLLNTNINCLADMDAADVANVQFSISFGSKTVDIFAAAATVSGTGFYGFLMA
jgi:hypothetical protein